MDKDEVNKSGKTKGQISKGSTNGEIKKVAVLYAESGLPEAAISAKSAAKVIAALELLGYEVKRVPFSKHCLYDIQKSAPQAVFNCLHGTLGEDGSISGALNAIGMPYTHSGVLASSLCFNKLFTYNFFSSFNIRMPKTFLVQKEDLLSKDLPLKYPFILKPVSQGSSIGVSLIHNDQELLSYEFLDGDNALLQEYIPGKELQIAILDGRALGALEVKPLEREFYDYYSKYTQGTTQYIMPPTIDDSIIKETMTMAEKIYKLSDCRSICRMEFIISENKEIFFLENNTNPGMTDLSICPMISQYYHGISYVELVNNVLKSACVD